MWKTKTTGKSVRKEKRGTCKKGESALYFAVSRQYMKKHGESWGGNVGGTLSAKDFL